MNGKLNTLTDLSGKVIIITGGGAGIGREAALLLAQAGASLMLMDLSSEKLNAIQNEIDKSGITCHIFAGDVTKESDVEEMINECIKHFGHLDGLVTCAGTQGANNDLTKELDTINIQNIINVDLLGVISSIKYAYPQIIKSGGGSIVNISSLAAISARGPIIYSAAKGGVKSFSRNIAKRLGPNNIRVNTIYPGFIVTEMTQKIYEHPDLVKHMENESPLGLLGDVDDIAYCILYLLSDASRFITGQDFVIDGGATA